MKPAATLAMLSLLALSPLAADQGVPEDEQDTASRASKLFATNRYDDAANLYRVIILEHPDCLYAYMNLGVIRSQQQHYDQALAAFSYALSLAPKSEQCLADLGLTHFRTCHYVDAAKYLTAAIALNPNDETLHDALGYVYDQLGRYDDARIEWDRAKAMDHKEIIKHLEDAEPDDKTRNSS